MKIEYRKCQLNRGNEESRTIEGYGAVFESESEDMGFIEILHRGAITEDTIICSDVFATFNHDTDKILARSKYGKGTLQLSIDENGLFYRFDAPNTQTGNEVLEYLNRGDLDSSSFAFAIDLNDEGSVKWEKVGDKYYRHIYKIARLYDVSPVWNPAYSSTSAVHRNQASDYEKEIKALDEAEKRELEEKNQEIMAKLDAMKLEMEKYETEE